MVSDEGITAGSNSPSSYGRYLTPQGSSDQSSFKSPEGGTPDWLVDDFDHPPPSYEDCLMDMDISPRDNNPRDLSRDLSRDSRSRDMSRSNSGHVRTSFI
jgi:hypothetical protein